MNSIALVMIARDEARCIARCLNSVRGVLDQVLVLDTGSTDATAAIARACGARVAHFTWCDDFAAARNAALELVDADWCLVLDADEWLESGADTLAALRHGTPDFIGLVRVDSVFDSETAGAAETVPGTDDVGVAAPCTALAPIENRARRPATQQAPSWLPRLLPRGVRYGGRVHEQPQSALPRRRLLLVAGHDGYLDAQRPAKLGRNERLLRQALAEQPHDAYLHYQLGKDLEVQRRFDEAALLYRHADELADARAGWRHDLVVRLVYTLKRLGRFEEGVLHAEREMAHWQHSPDFFFTLGDLLLDWAASEPERAVDLLPMIESSWLRALDIGEQPELQDTVRGRGSFLAAHNLAVFHQSLGDEMQARFWRSREAALRGTTRAMEFSSTC